MRGPWRRAGSAGRLAAVLLVVACAAAACGSSGGRLHGTGPASVADFGAVLATASDLGPVAPSRSLRLSLTLRQPDAQATSSRASLNALYNPASPTFGQYLTPAEYDARYGPDPLHVAALQAAARELGLDLSWTPGASTVTLSGPAQAMQRRLGVRVDDFRASDGRRFWAALGRPAIPAPLSEAVLPVDRMTSWMAPWRRNAVRPGGVTPSDLANAYDIRQLHDMGIDGAGETVVFWELADGFKQSDFDAFNAKYKLPKATPKVIGPADAPSDGETIMDIEAVHAVAPAANLVVYTLGAGQNLDDQSLMQIVDRTISENPGAIISYSWGGCEPGQGQQLLQWFEREFTKADQLGQSVYVSTGDSGGYECLTQRDAAPRPAAIGASMPAAAPGVTAVGGTRLSLSKDGSWYDEQPWKYATNTQGTGGGVSQAYPRPPWQRGPGVDNRWNPKKMRSVPDVSAIADPETGLSIVSGGQPQQGGGTSLSTPIWSGITALLNQYLKQKGLKPVGFINPSLYTIAAGSPPYPAFHDITVGGNLAYPATKDYDLATGLGTPQVWNLARDLEQYQRNGGRV